jgi:D-alanyl-D-alanine carboxypeptidase
VKVRQASSFRGGRRPLLSLLAAVALAVTAVGTAAANPKYSGIVIDANTGKVLYASSADAARYPASLTKMMTLYLTFEALANGRIKKNSRVVFSANAAAEPPSKLGIHAGGSISVEDAIYSLVTRSANDAATALGEFLGGSEADFARMMTAKARALGMRNTVFRNAHGLPNPAQHTSARDMALLGIALREHFPQYYGYFSTRSVVVAGKRLGNHNRLLGRVKGVDGIKTGYIRAAGFNLVTSVRDGNRSLVAVVMGGKTARSRDDQMAELIRTYLPRASTRDGAPLVASRRSIAPTAVVTANAIQLPTANVPTPDDRPTDSIVAFAGKTVSGSAAPVAARMAALPVPTARPKVGIASAPQQVAAAAQAAIAVPQEGEGDIDLEETASTAMSGWVIQVASVGSEAEAQALLARVRRDAGSLLSGARPFTEPFQKGGTLYVRARYGGFASKAEAWNTCGALKKKDISCYAVQQ